MFLFDLGLNFCTPTQPRGGTILNTPKQPRDGVIYNNKYLFNHMEASSARAITLDRPRSGIPRPVHCQDLDVSLDKKYDLAKLKKLRLIVQDLLFNKNIVSLDNKMLLGLVGILANPSDIIDEAELRPQTRRLIEKFAVGNTEVTDLITEKLQDSRLPHIAEHLIEALGCIAPIGHQGAIKQLVNEFNIGTPDTKAKAVLALAITLDTLPQNIEGILRNNVKPGNDDKITSLRIYSAAALLALVNKDGGNHTFDEVFPSYPENHISLEAGMVTALSEGLIEARFDKGTIDLSYLS